MIITKDIDGISGLCLVKPEVYKDDRGYFYESYNKKEFEKNGIYIDFVQDNQSMSTKGVLRGLHYQITYPQTKLVRVIKGDVWDVAVDLRQNSPTYLKWHGELLNEYNKHMFLIPKGFAHGFIVLSHTAEFCYKVDDFYHPNDEGGIPWNDPNIGIDWVGISMNPEDGKYYVAGSPLILSEKDKKWTKIFEKF